MNYKKTKFTCRCGFSIETFSTAKEDELLMESCSQCHHAFLGNTQDIKTVSKIDKFKEKFGDITDLI